MNIRTTAVAAAILAAAAAASAQVIDPMQSAEPRSRASTLKPERHYVNPNDASLSIAAANVQQPERRVVPQMTLPFSAGIVQRPEKTTYMQRSALADTTTTASAASYDTAFASCESLAGDGMRAVCLDRLARAQAGITRP